MMPTRMTRTTLNTVSKTGEINDIIIQTSRQSPVLGHGTRPPLEKNGTMNGMTKDESSPALSEAKNGETSDMRSNEASSIK
jgi:hypothetical protein